MVITLPKILKPIAIAQSWVTFRQLDRLDVLRSVMDLLLKLVIGKPHLRIEKCVTLHLRDIQQYRFGVRA